LGNVKGCTAGYCLLFRRVKPFKNVTLGPTVETLKM
jgi:hypothetical protein